MWVGALAVQTAETSRRFKPAQRQASEPTLVDRTSLEIIGFIFGAITAAVIVIAVFVVRSQVDAKIVPEQMPPVVPVSLAPQR